MIDERNSFQNNSELSCAFTSASSPRELSDGIESPVTVLGGEEHEYFSQNKYPIMHQASAGISLYFEESASQERIDESSPAENKEDDPEKKQNDDAEEAPDAIQTEHSTVHKIDKHKKKCSHCGTISTPTWRRSQDGKMFCSACQLYMKYNKVPRRKIIKNGRAILLRKTSRLWKELACSVCGSKDLFLYYEVHRVQDSTVTYVCDECYPKNG